VAVKIRLSRVGATKQPAYRVVVVDSRAARDSKAIETIGHYNPRTEPVEFHIDAEKATGWMAKGAKPSETVERLMRRAGILPEAR
jgi:small subunit ribosomal protein S16